MIYIYEGESFTTNFSKLFFFVYTGNDNPVYTIYYTGNYIQYTPLYTLCILYILYIQGILYAPVTGFEQDRVGGRYEARAPYSREEASARQKARLLQMQGCVIFLFLFFSN